MAEVRQTVTSSRASGLDDSGAAVDQQTKRVNTETTASGATVASNVVWFIYGIIAILLAMRFAFKLLGANPSNAFISFIYSISGILSAPFDTIFGVRANTVGQVQAVFEPSILVAIAVYGLIAWGIVKLLHLNKTEQV